MDSTQWTSYKYCYLLHSHIIYMQQYTYTCGNIVNTTMTSGHSSLEKYTSHTLFEMVTKGLLSKRWVGDWTKTATYWPPSSSGYIYIYIYIAALLSCSAGLLNRVPGGPALCWDLVLAPRTATTDFKLWSPTSWLPVAPGLYHCLTPICFLWRHNSHSIQPVESQGFLLISSTGCTCYLHMCISYLTAWPGRRSIFYIFNSNYSIQHSSFIFKPLNGSKFCYIPQTIQFQLFIYTELNCQTVLFLTT